MATRVNLNGSVKSPAKPRTTRKPKRDHLHHFCHGLVLFLVGSSAVLNGMHGAKSSVPAALVLAMVPPIVWTFGQVAAKLWKRNTKSERMLAKVIAGIALFGLVLSLIDVVQAIQEITHMSTWRAVAIGVMIDCGMVGCETTAALTKAEK